MMLKRLWSLAVLILAFSFLTAVSLSSCQSENGGDKENQEQTEGDTMSSDKMHEESGEMEEHSEHPEGDHPAGEHPSGEHPSGDEDSSDHPE